VTAHQTLGAIILGIGGDNSKGSAGTFYEGVMTSGYPSAATENSVQANIVAADYVVVPGLAVGTVLAGLHREQSHPAYPAIPAGLIVSRVGLCG
jgi:Alpha-L-arabinofuranosidase B, catalytic